MPLHDWTRVPSGLFHHFHQSWTIRLTDALNAGRLPRGVAALVEQRVGNVEADVLAIEARGREELERESGGVAVAARPQTRIVRRTNKEINAGRANRIVIRHHLGRVIAIVEIVSLGSNCSRAALTDFTEKTVQYLRRGVHALIVDPFPPTERDPGGIHKAIWDWIDEEPFVLPPGKGPHARLVSGRLRTGGLYRNGRRGGRTARHATIFNDRIARPRAVGSDLHGHLGRQPRRVAHGC